MGEAAVHTQIISKREKDYCASITERVTYIHTRNKTEQIFHLFLCAIKEAGHGAQKLTYCTHRILEALPKITILALINLGVRTT